MERKEGGEKERSECEETTEKYMQTSKGKEKEVVNKWGFGEREVEDMLLYLFISTASQNVSK